jgi:uncharacterized protein (DUF4213/DUF364 family)
MVFDETMGLLEELYGDELKTTWIEKVMVGLFFTGVKLSDGSGGVAYTPREDLRDVTCCPATVDARTNRLSFKGMVVADLFRLAGSSSLAGLITLAVMNALSSRFITPDRYRVVYDADALDLIPGLFPPIIPGNFPKSSSSGTGKIGMVGSFIPFLKRLKGIPDIDLTVIERNRASLRPDEMQFYAPAEDASKVLPLCDTAILTGSSIANGTIEDLLGYTRPGATVIVTGPTASLLPDALFARNATIVSGVKVTDQDLALDMLAEGLGAYFLFNTCVRKLNVIKE